MAKSVKRQSLSIQDQKFNRLRESVQNIRNSINETRISSERKAEINRELDYVLENLLLVQHFKADGDISKYWPTILQILLKILLESQLGG